MSTAVEAHVGADEGASSNGDRAGVDEGRIEVDKGALTDVNVRAVVDVYGR